LNDILRPDRPAAESLTALLEEAARRYAADRAAPGCLVLEGTRCIDPEAREAARAFSLAGEEVIRNYIAARQPQGAATVTDFVSTIMPGLSAKARDAQAWTNSCPSRWHRPCAGPPRLSAVPLGGPTRAFAWTRAGVTRALLVLREPTLTQDS
jgi:hypothetical protein